MTSPATRPKPAIWIYLADPEIPILREAQAEYAKLQ
jgi:hypothetical protein